MGSDPPAHRGAPRIGLVLSGGGARGLAHIPVLEAMDELGLSPSVIVGTSIGGIVGAGYAAGMSGRDIREFVIATFANRSDVLARLWQSRPKRIRDLFTERGFALGQFNAERILEKFMPPGLPAEFAGLKTPLKVIATDFYGWREVVLTHGPLLRALAASAAIPVLFRPVMIDDRVMMDGGIANPLPFDQVGAGIDLVVAVDVVGGPIDRNGRTPGAAEAIFGATQLFMQAIVREKMRSAHAPSILVRPPAESVRMLDFLKAATIIRSAEPIKDEVKRRLEAAIGAVERAPAAEISGA